MTAAEHIARDIERITRNFELYDVMVTTGRIANERRTAGSRALATAAAQMWRALAVSGLERTGGLSHEK